VYGGSSDVKNNKINSSTLHNFAFDGSGKSMICVNQVWVVACVSGSQDWQLISRGTVTFL
jgi:hypothetical protein